MLPVGIEVKESFRNEVAAVWSQKMIPEGPGKGFRGEEMELSQIRGSVAKWKWELGW